MPSTQVFAPDADLTALREHLDRQDPIHLQPQAPVMIAQGTADTAVTQPGPVRHGRRGGLPAGIRDRTTAAL